MYVHVYCILSNCLEERNAVRICDDPGRAFFAEISSKPPMSMLQTSAMVVIPDHNRVYRALSRLHNVP